VSGLSAPLQEDLAIFFSHPDPRQFGSRVDAAMLSIAHDGMFVEQPMGLT